MTEEVALAQAASTEEPVQVTSEITKTMDVCRDLTYSELQFLFGLDPACVTDTTWYQNDFTQAGAYAYYTSGSGDLLPPIFFANGGFCNGGEGGDCNEDIGWKGSFELERDMGNLNFQNRQQCKVATDKHATGYLYDSNLHCSYDTAHTVFAANVIWLDGLVS